MRTVIVALSMLVMLGCATPTRAPYGTRHHKPSKEWPYYKPMYKPYGASKLMQW